MGDLRLITVLVCKIVLTSNVKSSWVGRTKLQFPPNIIAFGRLSQEKIKVPVGIPTLIP